MSPGSNAGGQCTIESAGTALPEQDHSVGLVTQKVNTDHSESKDHSSVIEQKPKCDLVTQVVSTLKEGAAISEMADLEESLLGFKIEDPGISDDLSTTLALALAHEEVKSQDTSYATILASLGKTYHNLQNNENVDRKELEKVIRTSFKALERARKKQEVLALEKRKIHDEYKAFKKGVRAGPKPQGGRSPVKRAREIKKTKHKVEYEATMGLSDYLNFGATHKLDDEQFACFKELTDVFTSFREDPCEVLKKVDIDRVVDAKQVQSRLSLLLKGVVVETTGDLIGDLSKVLGTYAKSVTNSALIIVILALVAWVLSTRKSMKRVLFISVVAFLLYQIDYGALVHPLVEYITTWKPPQEEGEELFNLDTEMEYEAHIGSDQLSTIVDIFMIFAKTTTPSTWHSATSLSDLFKNLKGFKSAKEDLTSYLTVLLEVVEKFTNYILTDIAGLPAWRIITNDIPELEKWIAETTELTNLFRKGELPITMPNLERLALKQTEAQRLIGKGRSNAQNQIIFQKMAPLTRTLVGIMAVFDNSGIHLRGARQEPCVIMFRGGTGSGKSAMIRMFLMEVLPLVLSEDKLKEFLDDKESFFYSRMPEMKFWDGYLMQMVCIYDEFGMVPQKMQTAENEYAEMIRAGNVFDCPLHMADLSQKGSVFFRSLIIVCTSNISCIETSANEILTYPEALARRFHFDFLVYPQDRYCIPGTENQADLYKRKLNVAALPIDGTFVKEVYTLKDCKTNEIHSFDSAVTAVAHKFLRLQMKANKTDENEAEHLAHAMARRNEFAKHRELAEKAPVANHFVATIGIDPSDPRKILADAWDVHTAAKKIKGYRPGLGMEPIMVLEKIGIDPRLTVTTEVVDEIFKGFPIESKYLWLLKIVCADPDIRGWLDIASVYQKTDFLFWTAMRVDKVDELRDIVAAENENGMEFPLHWKCFYEVQLAGEKLSQLCTRLKDQLTKFFEEYPMLSAMTGFITGFGSVVILAKLTQYAWGFFFPDSAEGKRFELGVPPSKIQQNTWKNVARKMETYEANMGFSPAGYDEIALRIAKKVHDKNMYHMRDSHSDYGWVIFVVGNYLILPCHFIMALRARQRHKKGNIVKLRTLQGNSWEFEDHLFLRHVITAPGCDVAMVFLQTKLPKIHPDIRGSFVTDMDVRKRTSGGCLLFYPADGKVDDLRLRDIRFDVATNPITYPVPGTEARVNVARGIHINIGSSAGYCGLPMFLNDPTTRGNKIMGFIVAGVKTRAIGLTNLLTQETISGLFDLITSQDTQNPINLEYEATLGSLESRYEKIGEVSRGPGNQVQSSIRRSPLYGAWGPARTRIAHLAPYTDKEGIRINPFLRAVDDLDMPQPRYDPEIVQRCVDHLKATLINTSRPFEPRVLTCDEAIEGLPDEEYFNGIPRNTSAGFPYNIKPNQPGYIGKQAMFGKEGPYLLDGEEAKEVKRQVQMSITAWQEHKRPMYVYCMTLKDERLPLEKAKIKTRTFAAANVELVIATKMYFNDFLAWTMKNRIINGMCPGINVYSVEWNELARYLLQHTFVFGGDFKKFDKVMSQVVMETIAKMIRSFYKDEWDTVREGILLDVTSHRLLIGRDIMEFKGTNPSGGFLTTLMNSLYVQTVLRYAFCVTMGKVMVMPLRIFNDNVKIGAYGDDSVQSVSTEVHQIYNQKTIAQVLTELGQEYTDASKGSDFTASAGLDNVSFLKRTFIYDHSVMRYIAPLALETIMEMPYWSKKGGLYDEICRTNVETALVELSLHGERTFSTFAPVIIKASCDLLRYQPYMTDREDLLLFATGHRFEWLDRKSVGKSKFFGDLPYGTFDNEVGNDKSGKNKGTTVVEHNACVKVTALDGQLTANILSTQYEATSGLEWFLNEEPGEQTNNGNLESTPASSGMRPDDTSTANILTDGNTVSGGVTNKISDIDFLKNVSSIGYTDTIESFMRKPVILSSSTWSTAGPNTELYSFGTLDPIFTAPTFRAKMLGHYSVQATTVVRVVVNAAPTQAGILMLQYVPDTTPSRIARCKASLMQRTQCPHVMMDISCETEMMFRIPFISPDAGTFFGDPSPGTVHLVAVTSLLTGTGSVNVDYTVYVTYEDVKFGIPQYVATMGDLSMKKQTKRKNPTDAEGEALGVKPSAILNSVASSLTLASGVPLLSSFAAPAAWVAQSLSRVAWAFGYSKPNAVMPATAMHSVSTKTMGNCDGADNGMMASLTTSNALSILPGFAGTDNDEMSLAHIFSINPLINSYTWTQAQTTNAFIFNLFMSPDVGSVTTYAVTNTYRVLQDSTPAGYLSNLFEFWRGSFIMTIKIAKTEYHSGRLRLVYEPNASTGTIDQSQNLQEILDVREASEWEFTIPYANIAVWRRTNTATPIRGLVSLQVLNPLKAPDTVTSSVRVLVFIRPGPDFEFARLNTREKHSYYGTMGDCLAVSEQIGGVGATRFEIAYSEHTMGEQIKSVNQIIKCFRRAIGRNNTNGKVGISINPFMIMPPTSLVSPPINGLNGDYINLIYPLFAYCRGSMRVKIESSVDKLPYVIVGESQDGCQLFTIPTDVARFDTPLAQTYHCPLVSEGCPYEVTVPMFTSRPFYRVQNAQTITSRADTLPDFPRVNVVVGAKGVAPPASDMGVFRAAGDDVQLGMFIGTPKMLIREIYPTPT